MNVSDESDDFELINEDTGPSKHTLTGRELLINFRNNQKQSKTIRESDKSLENGLKITSKDLIMMNVKEKEEFFKKRQQYKLQL